MSYLSIDNSKLKLSCDYSEKDKAKAVSDYKWNSKDKTWDYPPTYDIFLSLKQAFSDLQIEPAILHFFKQSEEELKKGEAFKQAPQSSLPNIRLKSKPYEHQKTGISFLLNQKTCLLCDELGAGKSLQALGAAIARHNAGEVNHVLIICPSTIKNVWLKEILKHTYEKALVVSGTHKQREKIFKEYKESDILFLIMNYESVRVHPPPIDFSMLILDEVVRIKNSKAGITKRIKKIPCKYKIGLSGYPVANTVIDIWSQVDWIRPGYLGSRWGFEDRYMIKQTMVLKDSREFKQIMGYKNLKELQKKLYPLYIRRLKSEVLDLPPKIYETREIELNKEQKAAYAKMKEEMRVWIEDMDEVEVQAKARTILVQLLRLSQITDGFLTDVTWDKPIWFKESAKIKELDGLIEEVIQSGNKCVIWSRFVPMVLKLHERYKKYNAVHITGSVKIDDRTKNIDKFQNDPRCLIMIGQIQSGGMGITLTAANTEIFMDKAFISPSNIVQAIDRLHRIGQKKSVVIISLVAKYTVDTHWEKLLERKKKMAETLLGDKISRLNKKNITEMLK